MNKKVYTIIKKTFKCKLSIEELIKIKDLRELENFDSLNYMNYLNELETKFNLNLKKDLNLLYKFKNLDKLIKKNLTNVD